MQFENLSWLYDWLAQNNAASWARPLLIAQSVALVVAMLITYWPTRFAGAITQQEIWLNRSAPTVRLLNCWIQLLAIAILPVGIVLMAFSPARPYALVLNSQANPSSLSADQQKLPDRLNKYRQFDVTAIVQAALHRATEAGAGNWIAATPQQKNDLRQICLTVLDELGDDAFSQVPQASAAQYQLPKWVKESVEISIVHGLCLQRNIRFVGVWAGPETPGRGWSVANRLPLRSSSEIQVYMSPEVDPVRVLSAFGGEATTDNTRIKFHALVSQLPSSGSYRLPFRIVDHSSGKVQQYTYDVPPGPSTQVVKVEQVTTEFTPSANLQVELDDGRIRAALPLVSRGPQLEIALFGTSGSHVTAFLKTWQSLLGVAADGKVTESSPLRENLIKTGRSIPRLSVNPVRSPHQLALHLDYPSHCLSLLEAGLEKTDLSNTLFRREEIPLPQAVAKNGSPLTVRQSAWRASEPLDTASTLDSWMSTTVLAEPSGSQLWMPIPHPTATVLTSALRANTPISQGRYFIANSFAGGSEARFPFVELHRIATKSAVVIRLDSDAQQLFLPETSNKAGQSKYEYARSAALVNSIILGAHRLSRRQVSNSSDFTGSQSSGHTLLDLNSCVSLTKQRVEPSDNQGLMCISAFCFFAAVTGWFSRWPRRVSIDRPVF